MRLNMNVQSFTAALIDDCYSGRLEALTVCLEVLYCYHLIRLCLIQSK